MSAPQQGKAELGQIAEEGGAARSQRNQQAPGGRASQAAQGQSQRNGRRGFAGTVAFQSAMARKTAEGPSNGSGSNGGAAGGAGGGHARRTSMQNRHHQAERAAHEVDDAASVDDNMSVTSSSTDAAFDPTRRMGNSLFLAGQSYGRVTHARAGSELPQGQYSNRQYPQHAHFGPANMQASGAVPHHRAMSMNQLGPVPPGIAYPGNDAYQQAALQQQFDVSDLVLPMQDFWQFWIADLAVHSFLPCSNSNCTSSSNRSTTRPVDGAGQINSTIERRRVTLLKGQVPRVSSVWEWCLLLVNSRFPRRVRCPHLNSKLTTSTCSKAEGRARATEDAIRSMWQTDRTTTRAVRRAQMYPTGTKVRRCLRCSWVPLAGPWAPTPKLLSISSR